MQTAGPTPAALADMPAAASADTSLASPATRALPRVLFSPAALWLGATVPKRWARRSVTRHAIKRQVYDLGRTLLPADEQAAYVVSLRASFARDQFQSATSDLLKAAVRAELSELLAAGARARTARHPAAAGGPQK